tara:strand:+ start:4613 stop:5446 length:834 start_codon:yes stop_codon:yes gene_type:complete
VKATVLGSSGYIGQAMAPYLRGLGYDVACPARGEIDALSGDLGAVFYCIGITGNFRTMPYQTVDAQVQVLARLLSNPDIRFDSLVYLSSTRVYGTGGDGLGREDMALSVIPSPDSTYDLSKLLGEALCAAHTGATMISVRLSNVYGPDMREGTFLGSVLKTVADTGAVEIGEDPGSGKDYVPLDYVVRSMELLARKGEPGCYNIATGVTVTHDDIARVLRRAGYTVTFRQGGPLRRFPAISTEKLQALGGCGPKPLLESLIDLIPNTQSRMVPDDTE